MQTKNNPHFTWFRWGAGAEKWGLDSRARAAVILAAARKRHECERLGCGFYRVTLRNHDTMALIRTRTA
jgi:hypothetical protein